MENKTVLVVDEDLISETERLEMNEIDSEDELILNKIDNNNSLSSLATMHMLPSVFTYISHGMNSMCDIPSENIKTYGSSKIKKHSPDSWAKLKNTPCQKRNDPCACGSGKKYKKCCMKD